MELEKNSLFRVTNRQSRYLMKHIYPLTSLRFFFSLMVFFSHLNLIVRNTENHLLKSIDENIFYEGYLGVSFFFILSGFILSYTYQDKLLNNSVSKNSFLLNRFTRIYPLHFLTLILSFPLAFYSIEGFDTLIKTLIKLVFNITLTQSFIPLNTIYFSFNSPSWSISNELFFYLLTPLLFTKFSNLNFSKILGFIFIFLVFIILGIEFIPEQYHHRVFYINPFIRLFDFILGIFLFYIFKRIKQSPSFLSSTLLEIGGVLTFLLFFYFHNDVSNVYRYSIYYWTPMVIVILIFSISKGFLSVILSNRVLVYLGEISFGFYLIHQLVIKYFSVINRRLDLNLDGLTQIIIVSIISIFLSILSFEFFENRVREPVKIFLKRRFKI